ncbi:chaperone protein [Nannochloropsis gaditana CCMP526]|uniref:chaperone protein n=1 Tax=Nannochloropsis gaditana (strain CCMP526) TaxID=1093141 RepID=UPI00029F8007|nr:chaperone protein [Nannochloropsis gaditana CCMP526]EKU20790.1 chaperone protein [Nannochloropsis gaditana CCMP526]|eukprot:XP_005855575.1 chaperone protein [Nannochloropsis gaditana CCMP526]
MVELTVPAGIQHDTMLVMRGRGVRELQGSRRGNQIVHVKIEIPKTLSSKQKELMQAFQEEEEKKKAGGRGGGGCSSSSSFFTGGFQGRVKEAYARIKEYLGKEKEKEKEKKSKEKKKSSASA